MSGELSCVLQIWKAALPRIALIRSWLAARFVLNSISLARGLSLNSIRCKAEPDGPATCVALPSEKVKGIRDAVKIYEVPWKTEAMSSSDAAKTATTG